MISDVSATELGYPNREALFSAFSEASKIIQRCEAHLAKNDVQRRRDLVTSLEKLIAKCALKSNIHDLADAAAREAPARYANRLSPGYNDAQKTENASGDFIIWKEILGHCGSKGVNQAVLMTNDRKSDWVYTPRSVILPNGRAISGHNAMARLVKLPKPDLIAEFERHTGSTQFHIFSIESVIEALSSAELNHWDAQDFRHLALAIQLDLARTPTEAVVQWFLKIPTDTQKQFTAFAVGSRALPRSTKRRSKRGRSKRCRMLTLRMSGGPMFFVNSSYEKLPNAGPGADCLQRPVRHSSSCSIPIVDGKDSEEILGSAAYLNSKGRGDRSLPAKPRAERRR